ncbi:endolytic transglycosylase MltG [Streptomyces mirabilis]|uniref:endolytic transglycosylase MltG n=1 Tax=Streptomyces mirabilis TaxID=68239 RepID=UPI0033F32444
MQMNTPPRSTIRLTRRGRVALIATGAVVAATAVTVPLLTLTTKDEETRPTSLVIPEGWRTGQVYEAVDEALALPLGSTKKSLAKANLKLPTYAEGNPEGYLYPTTYHIDKTATPESLLALMVNTANKKFSGSPITAGAQRNAMNLYQAITIASIIQAETSTKADMGKVARVIFNRLERGMPLQMDATLNYALNRFTPTTTTNETKLESPYNSYQRMGLPPTPISNPGQAAMRAAINPTPGNWLYFVTVKPGDTRFTASYEEQQRNVAEFKRLRRSASPSASNSSSNSISTPLPGSPSASALS